MNVHEIAVNACTRFGAMQNQGELAAALEMARDITPKVIVEIGCMNGGTLYAWRQICTEVYAITLPNLNPDYPVSHGAVVHLQDSHEPVALDWIKAQLDSRGIDVLHIDGDHAYDGVKADYDMYAPLVRGGGLVFIHDIANDRDAPEVGKFWRTELAHLPGAAEIVAGGSRPIGFGVITKEMQ